MKQIVIGAVSGIATAALLFATSSANASPQSIETWVKAANQKLERRMVYPSNGASGIVTATFQRGPDGSPVAVEIRPTRRALMNAARATLNRVRDLPPLPPGYGDKRIRMQMLIGDPANATEYYTQRKQLLASAQVNNVQLASRQRSVEVAASQAR